MTEKPADLASHPATLLKGVGPRVAARLQKLHISSVQDVLFHLPLRYEDRTRITPLNQLQPGMHAVIEAKVVSTEITHGRRTSFLCHVTDGQRELTLRFFYFNPYQQRQLQREGIHVRCYAEVRWGPNGLEMVHPDYQVVNRRDPQPLEQTLTPIYPATEGLTQYSIRKIVTQALLLVDHNPEIFSEQIPTAIRQRFGLCDCVQAIRYCHQPPATAKPHELASGQHPMQQRLAFEELLAQNLSLQRLRARIQQDRAVVLDASQCREGLPQRFLERLPFSLTGAQQRVCAELAQDLAKPVPMLRLVQGDVGSGKTVVAAFAALQAVAQGFQVAIMAPTEILAQQHFHNFKMWLNPLGIEIAWLVSKLSPKNRQAALRAITNNQAQVVIGTHALFQDGVEFAKLALVIIDEQHRFGVHQRLALKQKGMNAGMSPHQLIMTATPIPRTLAMTAYADLDVSVIDELPPGRQPVTTIAVANQRRDEVIARVATICRQQQQAYWVCTLIEESEVLQCQAAQATQAALQAALAGIRVALVHGRLKPDEKATVMAQFKAGQIDLLVATTVIEVGVDVPNASLMVIENPERLGLAQLHQLRGRIGRGSQASHCVLLYQMPLSQQARARLKVMRQSHDGFVIAQQDLQLRGPGEVLGTKQTGLLQLKIADILRDKHLLPQVRQAAQMILSEYPESAEPIINRWLANKEHYGSVF